ncbi:hypothetical protein PoB_007583400 [Plakobranchus ocellatus]|uniref:Uncharacterized protein n=1 Tax=Plakobranchus ocellatus TaxID=259542 RepID=A0AAV4DYP1_9GAST|nr:hypothetical protein PoB_007583400 [Plakobranchus ocellatus]
MTVLRNNKPLVWTYDAQAKPLKTEKVGGVKITVRKLLVGGGGRFLYKASPQRDDVRLSGPPSGQGAGGGARTCDRWIPADLTADSLATVPPTPRVSESKLAGPKLILIIDIKIDNSFDGASLFCFSYDASKIVQFDKDDDALREKSLKLKLVAFGIAGLLIIALVGCTIFTCLTKPEKPKPAPTSDATEGNVAGAAPESSFDEEKRTGNEEYADYEEKEYEGSDEESESD